MRCVWSVVCEWHVCVNAVCVRVPCVNVVCVRVPCVSVPCALCWDLGRPRGDCCSVRGRRARCHLRSGYQVPGLGSDPSPSSRPEGAQPPEDGAPAGKPRLVWQRTCPREPGTLAAPSLSLAVRGPWSNLGDLPSISRPCVSALMETLVPRSLMRFLFPAQRDLIMVIPCSLASVYPPSPASAGKQIISAGLDKLDSGLEWKRNPVLLLQTKLAGGQHMLCWQPLSAQSLRAIRAFQEAPHPHGRQGPH